MPNPASPPTADPRLERIVSLIRDVPDFPKPGILFYDITTLLKDPCGFRASIDGLKQHYREPKVDTVVGIGKRSQALLDGARDAGFEKAKLHHFDDAQSAGEFLKTFIRPGDLVLIKASRGIGLDRIVNMLTNSGPVEGAH